VKSNFILSMSKSSEKELPEQDEKVIQEILDAIKEPTLTGDLSVLAQKIIQPQTKDTSS